MEERRRSSREEGGMDRGPEATARPGFISIWQTPLAVSPSIIRLPAGLGTEPRAGFTEKLELLGPSLIGNGFARSQVFVIFANVKM